MIYRDEPVQEIRASSRKVKIGQRKKWSQKNEAANLGQEVGNFAILKIFTNKNAESKKGTEGCPANFCATNQVGFGDQQLGNMTHIGPYKQ